LASQFKQHKNQPFDGGTLLHVIMDILGHSQQWLVCNGRVRFVERIWGITHNSQFFGGLRYGKP